ncbi:hypothetical protein [Natronosalvus vescus]|uniref:hypothetical protein n=1 Tax=Natronosalvus vescus TaxID=2953881 RepID=UPI002090C638|nr:hypothetical protein [Natronosalvus vescus]
MPTDSPEPQTIFRTHSPSLESELALVLARKRRYRTSTPRAHHVERSTCHETSAETSTRFGRGVERRLEE